MADILDLGSGNCFAARRTTRQSSGQAGTAADIIIFPGVRYERDEKKPGKPGGKRPASKKKTVRSIDRN